MTAAPRLTAARLAQLRQQLSTRDWAVVEDVARCRLMTGRQLQQLHVGNDETAARAARRLLARLSRLGVLARLERQVGGVRAGSSGYVYGLGAAGSRLLYPEAPRPRLHEVRDGFLAHTLAIAQLYVDLRHADQRGDVDLLAMETEPQCWRRLDGGDWLKPDAYVVLGIGDEALYSFVEVDRGSEHSPALLRKLHQYEDAYRQGAGGTPVFPRVVWLVPTAARADLLHRLCHRHGLTPELHAIARQLDALAVLAGGPDGDQTGCLAATQDS